MASKRNPSDPAGPTARPPRRPPTIELESTEFSADPAQNPAQNREGAAAPPDPQATKPDGIAWLPSSNARAVVATGVVVGAGVLVVILLFWSTGFFGGGSNSLDNRIAGIEAQLRELAARPVPTRNDTRTIEELSARLSRVEQTTSAPPSQRASTART